MDTRKRKDGGQNAMVSVEDEVKRSDKRRANHSESHSTRQGVCGIHLTAYQAPAIWFNASCTCTAPTRRSRDTWCNGGDFGISDSAGERQSPIPRNGDMASTIVMSIKAVII